MPEPKPEAKKLTKDEALFVFKRACDYSRAAKKRKSKRMVKSQAQAVATVIKKASDAKEPMEKRAIWQMIAPLLMSALVKPGGRFLSRALLGCKGLGMLTRGVGRLGKGIGSKFGQRAATSLAKQSPGAVGRSIFGKVGDVASYAPFFVPPDVMPEWAGGYSDAEMYGTENPMMQNWQKANEQATEAGYALPHNPYMQMLQQQGGM